MAKQIKETPILRGKDAENFLKSIENSEKLSIEVRKNIKSDFDYLTSIAKF
jgi:hypothetical protein